MVVWQFVSAKIEQQSKPHLLKDLKILVCTAGCHLVHMFLRHSQAQYIVWYKEGKVSKTPFD
jgi:hypothetical protein